MNIKFLQKLLLGACALGTLAAPSCHAFEVLNDTRDTLRASITIHLNPRQGLSEEEWTNYSAFRDLHSNEEGFRDLGVSEDVSHVLYRMICSDYKIGGLEGHTLRPGEKWIGQFDESLAAALRMWLSPDAPEQMKFLDFRLGAGALMSGAAREPSCESIDMRISRDDPIAQRLSDPEFLEQLFIGLQPVGNLQVAPAFDSGDAYGGHLKGA